MKLKGHQQIQVWLKQEHPLGVKVYFLIKKWLMETHYKS